jgi:hypothetical protein
LWPVLWLHCKKIVLANWAPSETFFLKITALVAIMYIQSRVS